MYWVETNESVLLKDMHWDRLMEEGQATARCASKQVAPLGLLSPVPNVSCVHLCVPPYVASVCVCACTCAPLSSLDSSFHFQKATASTKCLEVILALKEVSVFLMETPRQGGL